MGCSLSLFSCRLSPEHSFRVSYTVESFVKDGQVHIGSFMATEQGDVCIGEVVKLLLMDYSR